MKRHITPVARDARHHDPGGAPFFQDTPSVGIGFEYDCSA